jgi:hypothetical protein
MSRGNNQKKEILIMSEETQAVRIETGEEAALELMKFIAEKENKNVSGAEARDYYLDLFIECAHAVYHGERTSKK